MTTALTVNNLPTPFATAGLLVALTTTDGAATFWCDGNTFLLAVNIDVSSHTITISSVADPTTGRVGDITADTVPAGNYRVYQVFPQAGWKQSTGLINVTVSDTHVHLGAYRLQPIPGMPGLN